MSAGRFNRVLDQLESSVIPATQIYNLFYKDLVADPMGTIDAMYDRFGIPLSKEGRAGMVRYLAENPRDSRPPHKFNAGSDEAVTRARKAFKRYQDYFEIPIE